MFHSLTITRPPPQSVIKDSFCFGRAPEMNPMWCLFAFATWLAWTRGGGFYCQQEKKRKEKKRPPSKKMLTWGLALFSTEGGEGSPWEQGGCHRKLNYTKSVFLSPRIRLISCFLFFWDTAGIAGTTQTEMFGLVFEVRHVNIFLFLRPLCHGHAKTIFCTVIMYRIITEDRTWGLQA